MDAVRRTDRRTDRGSAASPAIEPALRLTARARERIHREALDFLADRYSLGQAQRAALAAIPVRWRRGRGASAYYPRRAHGFAGPHILLRVAPGRTARWHTYRRARARFSTPPEGIELDTRVLATAILVHELTHALQHGAAGGVRRRFSEVETTGNEMEFVRLRAPGAFARLQPVLRRAPRRAGAGRKAVAQSPLAALRAIVLRAAGRIAGIVSPSRAPRRPTSRPRSRSPRPTGS